MSNMLLKKDIVDKISEKLINEKIDIGGNGKKYKRKYHLRYTQKIIVKVLDAFWEVIADSVEEGCSIKLNNYIKLEPRYYKAVKLNANGFNNVNTHVVPARYKIKFTMGKCLKKACENLSKEKCNNNIDN